MSNIYDYSARCFNAALKRGQISSDYTIRDTMNTIKHCSGELIEMAEAYTLFENRENFCDEWADAMCCLLTIAEIENIDIKESLERCIRKNELRALKK